MKGLRKLLIEEYLRLEKIAGKLRKELADMPEGTLRVSKSHNYTQFYNVKKENDMKCPKISSSMMDNPEYAGAAVRKIESYEKNGIYPGENLILTFETQQNVLDFKIIEEMIDRYLQ